MSAYKSDSLTLVRHECRNRSGRKSRRRQLKASHQKNWLVGQHAVHETLAAGVWRPEDLYVVEDPKSDDLEILAKMALDKALKTTRVGRERLTELCGSRHHQGVAARMGPFPYRNLTDVSELLASGSTASMRPCIVVCDRIMDAHNFGAILRCCDAMKVAAVVIGETEQVGVTPHVARASSGAVNHVPVVSVEGPGRCLQVSAGTWPHFGGSVREIPRCRLGRKSESGSGVDRRQRSPGRICRAARTLRTAPANPNAWARGISKRSSRRWHSALWKFVVSNPRPDLSDAVKSV